MLKEKALDCLAAAALPIGSPERVASLDRAATKWSWRALDLKMEELVARGYIEPLLGGTAQGNLTVKGRAVLDAQRCQSTDPDEMPDQ